MDILKLFGLSFITLSLLSCKDDDQVILDKNQQILGEWTMSDLDGEGTTDVVISGISTTVAIDLDGKEYNFDTEFSDNPRVVSSSGNFVVESSVSLLGQTQIQDITINELDNLNGTWRIEGENLIITDENNVEQTAVIEELTSTKLEVTLNQEIDQTFQGTPVVLDLNLEIEFTKK